MCAPGAVQIPFSLPAIASLNCSFSSCLCHALFPINGATCFSPALTTSSQLTSSPYLSPRDSDCKNERDDNNENDHNESTMPSPNLLNLDVSKVVAWMLGPYLGSVPSNKQRQAP